MARMRFADQVEAFAKKTGQKVIDVRRGTALSVFGDIVTRTPVGNASAWENPGLWRSLEFVTGSYVGGGLRANWQASIGAPASGTVNSTSESTSRGSISKAAAMLRGDSPIYLTNNLPYAQRIEDGYSKQAPTGMVKVSIRAFKRHVMKQAKKVNR